MSKYDPASPPYSPGLPYTEKFRGLAGAGWDGAIESEDGMYS